MSAARRALFACLALARCTCDLSGALDAGAFACAGDDECARGWFCTAGRCYPDGTVVIELDAGIDAGPLDAALRFTTPSRIALVGECSPPVGLDLVDDAGADFTAPNDVSVTMSGGGLDLFSDPACTSQLTQLQLRRDAGLYFLGKLPGTFQLIATSPQVAPAAQVEQLLPAGPVRLELTNAAPPPVAAGTCLPFTVELRGATDASVPAPVGGVQVSVDSTPLGLRCFGAPDCTGIELPTFVIPVGVAAARVYCAADTGQAYDLSFKAMGLMPVKQSVSVQPVVRTGTCDFAVGEFMKNCTVNPAQLDVNRTFLVYQVTSANHDPEDASASCVLTGPSTVKCARFQIGGTAQVTWQTVELRDARVDRYDVPCNPDGGNDVTVGLDASVPPARAFLLNASSQAGQDLNGNDTYTARLGSATQLDLRWGDGCNAHNTQVQVVQVPGFNVTRAAGSLVAQLTDTATGLGAADGGTFVLSTWRTSAVSTSSRICDRMLRVQPGSPGAVVASRADGNTDTQCIESNIDAWEAERVDVGQRARVQQVVVRLDAGVGSALRTVSAVDVSRAFVLASGQTAGVGQAVGEGGYSADGGGYLGETSGTLRLSSPTQVQLDRGSARGSAVFTVYVVEMKP